MLSLNAVHMYWGYAIALLCVVFVTWAGPAMAQWHPLMLITYTKDLPSCLGAWALHWTVQCGLCPAMSETGAARPAQLHICSED